MSLTMGLHCRGAGFKSSGSAAGHVVCSYNTVNMFG